MATLHAKRKWAIEDDSFFPFFNSLPPKPDTTVHVYDHDEFYSIHGKDAFLGAKIVFDSHASIKNLNNKAGKVEKLKSSAQTTYFACKFYLLLEIYL